MKHKPRGRPRSETAKKAILSSANSLIEQVGITGLTIEAVASKAKVGKPTIYRYWSNARDLAMAALMASASPSEEQTHSDFALDELRSQLRAVIQRFSTPSGRQAAILMASADRESELSKAFRNQVILKSREQGRSLITLAINQQELPPNLPIEALLDMIYGPIFYRLLVGHEPLTAELADELVSTIHELKRSS